MVKLQVVVWIDIPKRIIVMLRTNRRGFSVMMFNATFNNISVIYHGGQFYWWRKLEYPEKTTDLS